MSLWVGAGSLSAAGSAYDSNPLTVYLPGLFWAVVALVAVVLLALMRLGTLNRQLKEKQRELKESEARLNESIQERIRLGRDLHDGIIQSIYGVGLGLRDCRRLMGRDPEEATRRLDRSVEDLNSVIREVRGFIMDLRPPGLAGSDLRQELQAVITGFGEEAARRIQLEMAPKAEKQFSGRQAAELIQVAREALSNALRHGEAALITVGAGGPPLFFEVRDNGRGFDPAKTTPGQGLPNMKARALDLGAEFLLETAPGAGTAVRIEWRKGV